MSQIEYDLDLTGGLIEEIHRLVAPPNSELIQKPLRIKERISNKKLSKQTPNHDTCDSCKEGGDLLSCDSCSSSFHLLCQEPPLEEDNLLGSEWMCRQCLSKNPIDTNENSEPLNSSLLTNINSCTLNTTRYTSTSIQNKFLKSNYNKSSNSFDGSTVKDGDITRFVQLSMMDEEMATSLKYGEFDQSLTEKICHHITDNKINHSPCTKKDCQSNRIKLSDETSDGAILELNQITHDMDKSKSDEIPCENKTIKNENIFNKLVNIAKISNPKQFELPNEFVCPILLPGTSKSWMIKRKKETKEYLRQPGKIIELEKGIVPFPLKLCFHCSRSCRIAPLLSCDYCSLVFHLECLNPPLSSMPSSNWKCPNHVEHILDENLLNSKSLTKRLKLWSRYNGPIDTHNIKLQFFKKCHQSSIPFVQKFDQTINKKINNLTAKIPPPVVKIYRRHRQKLNEVKSISLEDQECWLNVVSKMQNDFIEYLKQQKAACNINNLEENLYNKLTHVPISANNIITLKTLCNNDAQNRHINQISKHPIISDYNKNGCIRDFDLKEHMSESCLIDSNDVIAGHSNNDNSFIVNIKSNCGNDKDKTCNSYNIFNTNLNDDYGLRCDESKTNLDDLRNYKNINNKTNRKKRTYSELESNDIECFLRDKITNNKFNDHFSKYFLNNQNDDMRCEVCKRFIMLDAGGPNNFYAMHSLDPNFSSTSPQNSNLKSNIDKNEDFILDGISSSLYFNNSEIGFKEVVDIQKSDCKMNHCRCVKNIAKNDKYNHLLNDNNKKEEIHKEKYLNNYQENHLKVDINTREETDSNKNSIQILNNKIERNLLKKKTINIVVNKEKLKSQNKYSFQTKIIRIGTASSNDIILNDDCKAIFKEHCTIYLQDDNFWIELLPKSKILLDGLVYQSALSHEQSSHYLDTLEKDLEEEVIYLDKCQDNNTKDSVIGKIVKLLNKPASDKLNKGAINMYLDSNCKCSSAIPDGSIILSNNIPLKNNSTILIGCHQFTISF